MQSKKVKKENFESNQLGREGLDPGKRENKKSARAVVTTSLMSLQCVYVQDKEE